MKEKTKVLVLVGGKSNEHEVSIISGFNIYKNIGDKYIKEIIYLDKENKPYEIDINESLKDEKKIGYIPKLNKEIPNLIEYVKKYDVVFPVIHGGIGEDGKMQGLLETANVKYVGCRTFSSALTMDKVYTKLILDRFNIKNAKYIYLRSKKGVLQLLEKDGTFKNILKKDLKTEIGKRVKEELDFPVFVKPSNSGSSVGVTKAENEEELVESIFTALNEDSKVLIEEAIIGKEIECAVLETKDKLIASRVGCIEAADTFYSYDSKYLNAKEQTRILDLDSKLEKEIQEFAKKVFNILDAREISRVDMFLIEEEGKHTIYLNEINTMPGFTEISMYPKLLEDFGFTQEELINELIQSALID